MIRRRTIYLLLALLTAVFIAVQVWAQVEEPPTNIAIIMDASGSMQALLEGGRSRIAVARDEIIALSSEFAETVNASLWVYGHRLSQDDPAASCLDIEEVIPLGPTDAAAFASTVSSVNAIGYTPIATSLGMAYSSLPNSERDIIVLMSDGEESCGGDPCAIAAELDARNIELRIHTIGFAADAGTRAQLQCIAEVTGGNYYEAQDTEGLRQALRAATAPVTGTIAVVRSDGEIASGVGFMVVDSTGATVGSVVGSGSFAPGDYAVTVNTDPPLEATVTVVAGETATIVLPELGLVRVVNAAGEVLEQFPLTAYTPSTTDIVGFSGGGSLQLPPGQYEVGIGDTDRREAVTLGAGETVDITVDFGTLQLVDANGSPTDAYPFYIFTEGSVEVVEFVTSGTTNLFAGTYDVEVQTDPRLSQSVTITAGETTQIVLPGIGTLQLVDSSGTPIGDYTFYVYPEGGNAQTIVTDDGSVDLVAGTYGVEVQTDPPTRETVVITADQTTQIVLPGIGTVQLVDVAGNPTDEYNFYTYPEGDDEYVAFTTSGTVQIAEGSYDVEVLTNPRTRQTVTVTANEITTVQIGGIGMLQLVDTDGNPTDEYNFYTYPEGEDEYVAFANRGSIDVAAGTYEVEITTNPRLRQTVTVMTGETTEIALPGIGMLQLVDAEGNPTDEYNFYIYPEGDDEYVAFANRGSIDVVADTYDVEVTTSPPTRQTVTVVADQVVTVQLGGIGSIQLMDAEGNPTDEYNFYVFPEGDDEYIAFITSGIAEVAAGTYEVEVTTSPPTRQTVTVVADQVVTVQLGGIGSIQLVDAEGNPTDEYNFYVFPEGDDEYIAFITSGIAEVAAGTYEVEVTTSPPTRQTVTVVADQVVTVQLGGIGSIQLVDAEGTPTDEYSFYVYPEGEDEFVAFTVSGIAEVAAGSYEVEVFTNPIMRQTVMVVADEVANVQLGGIGTLQLVDASGEPTDEVGFYVYPEGEDTLATYVISGTVDLLEGDYEVEFSTQFGTRYPVTITADETAEISLPEVSK